MNVRSAKQTPSAHGTMILTSAVLVLCATATDLPAQTFTTLYSFCSQTNCTDGELPEAGLVQATNGRLYGTAWAGGKNAHGTVFNITPGGALATIYSFCSQTNCTDGANPKAGLIQANDGDLYGTTYGGGSQDDGTIFKISLRGVLTTLYSFCSLAYCADGYYPQAGLVQAADGSFYGTTRGGGADGSGTVFKITRGGTLTTLWSFCSQSNCTDGGYPGPLIQADDGDFYGTTGLGSGTIFRITANGTLNTLYSFCPQSPCTDGSVPNELVQAADGNFYGTTNLGGANDGGTVFEITPGGALQTLYSFCSQGGTQCTDGAYPEAGLVQATDGNFYGTTYSAPPYGTVFQITPSGTLTTLHTFSNTPDGAYPMGELIQATNGKIYGTTSYGGADTYGTVFSLSLGLRPFVETESAAAKVGATVKILGTNLAAATSVSFNGTLAVFEVVSGSLITTTVPAGATTGEVEVVTPGGTLSSNVPFRVLP